jgi:hypothetical protein
LGSTASYKPSKGEERTGGREKEEDEIRERDLKGRRRKKRVYSQALLYLSPHYTPFEHKDSSQEGQQGK